MTTLTLTRPRAPRAAFANMVFNEARLAWRQPAGIIAGAGIALLLLVIFGEIPVFRQPSANLGGRSAFGIYIPVLMSFSIAMIAFTYLPGPLVSYRELGILRRLSTTPVPAYWVLAAQIVVQTCLMVVTLALLVTASIVSFGISAARRGRAGDRRLVGGPVPSRGTAAGPRGIRTGVRIPRQAVLPLGIATQTPARLTAGAAVVAASRRPATSSRGARAAAGRSAAPRPTGSGRTSTRPARHSPCAPTATTR